MVSISSFRRAGETDASLVRSIQKGSLNFRGFSFAGDFFSDQIILAEHEARVVEQQFDDCLLCRTLADTDDIFVLQVVEV